MNFLGRAITLALGTVGFVASAQAATFVVTANGSSFDTKLARKVEAAGGKVTARLPQIGVAIVESDDTGFAARASRVAGVHSVAKDVVLQFDVPPDTESVGSDFANPPNSSDNDRFFDLQWGHAAVDAAGAWNKGYRGAGAKVAVLDSGIACAHPDIASNLIQADSASFVPGEDFCLKRVNAFNHGSHVAGTIASPDNGIGTIGVAPEAKLIAVKVLSEVTGSGSFSGIIQGLVHAADRGADVINMSLGVRGGLQVNGPGANDVRELVNATARATRYAAKQNALIVVSAGNDGRDLDKDSSTEVCDADGSCFNANLRAFPGELPAVLTIAATAPIGWAKDTSGSLDYLASYSNYGQSAIDFAGPGGDSSYPGDDTCTVAGLARPCWVFDLVFSVGGYRQAADGSLIASYNWTAGTSMAAPHVSGVAALIIGKNGGEMAPAAVERVLRASSDDLGKPGNDSLYGGGRVNASRAVSQ
ncbi:S8 family serine peptidase [Lysobacter korlensis]|uniref:S8 family serine peptidase n=1 Tax=Lysobacter korlensis TaxID=553636 RepID=A0ABV6RRA7_9GAMM